MCIQIKFYISITFNYFGNSTNIYLQETHMFSINIIQLSVTNRHTDRQTVKDKGAMIPYLLKKYQSM